MLTVKLSKQFKAVFCVVSVSHQTHPAGILTAQILGNNGNCKEIGRSDPFQLQWNLGWKLSGL